MKFVIKLVIMVEIELTGKRIWKGHFLFTFMEEQISRIVYPSRPVHFKFSFGLVQT